jgi:hypothetical protein
MIAAKHLRRLTMRYQPNEDEVEFMEYVKNNLNLAFSYESIGFE